MLVIDLKQKHIESLFSVTIVEIDGTSKLVGWKKLAWLNKNRTKEMTNAHFSCHSKIKIKKRKFLMNGEFVYFFIAWKLRRILFWKSFSDTLRKKLLWLVKKLLSELLYLTFFDIFWLFRFYNFSEFCKILGRMFYWNF